ncbi:PREDICTED: uncharacterized protein LOC109590822 [Amphimedon queenslandica]|uniref:Ig-like domain-containing protein n=1 Tax=Amphimedon queenslandica TaxID=400682 RepID=A0AAN0JZA3_AMPQE|nr:PREDICTED: uncharacterized protein LOC109590822 [Amphimedon queenslandica]|eukprot:XP_019862254.1 PREDICTED: uncharacterized protein LOC109590822 [Amphimedon queenslandica]
MAKVLDLLLLLLSLLSKSNPIASNVEVTFTLSPEPPIIAEGDTAVFNCSSNHSAVLINWILNGTVSASTLTSLGVIVNGAATPVSSLIIPGLVAPFNDTEVQCVAFGFGIGDFSPSSVILRVQGKLAPVKSLRTLENDSCYDFDWTPPFTLAGFDILRYNINVTDNNGNIIVQTNVSIAEWYYCPEKFDNLNLTNLCISIAAVNEVGEGELSKIKLNTTKYNIVQTQIDNRSRDKNQNWILSITIILEQLTGSDSEKPCINDVLMNCTDSNASFNTSNIMQITDFELMATFNISLEKADDKNHTIITHISFCSVLDEYESDKNNSLPISKVVMIK